MGVSPNVSISDRKPESGMIYRLFGGNFSFSSQVKRG
jgi:hypothetical protein